MFNKWCIHSLCRLVLIYLFIYRISQIKTRLRRSIELTSSQKLISDARLPTDVTPTSYELKLYPNLEAATFNGSIKINITWKATTKKIELHAHFDLNINETDVRVRLLRGDQ